MEVLPICLNQSGWFIDYAPIFHPGSLVSTPAWGNPYRVNDHQQCASKVYADLQGVLEKWLITVKHSLTVFCNVSCRCGACYISRQSINSLMNNLKVYLRAPPGP